jgi:hypothetical protein
LKCCNTDIKEANICILRILQYSNKIFQVLIYLYFVSLTLNAVPSITVIRIFLKKIRNQDKELPNMEEANAFRLVGPLGIFSIFSSTTVKLKGWAHEIFVS